MQFTLRSLFALGLTLFSKPINSALAQDFLSRYFSIVVAFPANQLMKVTSAVMEMTLVVLTSKYFRELGKASSVVVASATRVANATYQLSPLKDKPISRKEFGNGFGFFEPSKTLHILVPKLNATVTTTLKDHELGKKLRDQGGELMLVKPQQFME